MIDELDALYNQATPGEWMSRTPLHDDGLGPRRVELTKGGIVADVYGWELLQATANARFIVAMHNAWLTLRDRLRKAERLEREAKAGRGTCTHRCCVA